MPFVVQTDGKNKVVNIGIVSAAHGSHVAGIIAANGLFNADTMLVPLPARRSSPCGSACSSPAARLTPSSRE